VWLGTKADGTAGLDFRPVNGNEKAPVPNLKHHFGWFYITAIAQCGSQPPI
jgi:hypothetical protein